MIKLTMYQWQSLTHCAAVEASDNGAPNFKAYYGSSAELAAADYAASLSENIGQGIARIIIEEAPEE